MCEKNPDLFQMRSGGHERRGARSARLIRVCPTLQQKFHHSRISEYCCSHESRCSLGIHRVWLYTAFEQSLDITDSSAPDCGKKRVASIIDLR